MPPPGLPPPGSAGEKWAFPDRLLKNGPKAFLAPRSGSRASKVGVEPNRLHYEWVGRDPNALFAPWPPPI